MLFTKCFETESYDSVKKKIYFSIEAEGDAKLEDFIYTMHTISELDKNKSFKIEYIKDPIFSLRNAFADYISINGINSLYNFGFAQDAISAPCGKFEDNLSLHIKFIRNLCPTDNLLITDPFFYSEKDEKIDEYANTVSLIFEPLYRSIQEITVICQKNKFKNKCQDKIKNTLQEKSGKHIKFTTIFSEKCHDRFWISPNNTNGIVFGTSLNSIGKRLSLVDRLHRNDVLEILKFLRDENIYPCNGNLDQQ